MIQNVELPQTACAYRKVVIIDSNEETFYAIDRHKHAHLIDLELVFPSETLRAQYYIEDAPTENLRNTIILRMMHGLAFTYHFLLQLATSEEEKTRAENAGVERTVKRALRRFQAKHISVTLRNQVENYVKNIISGEYTKADIEAKPKNIFQFQVYKTIQTIDLSKTRRGNDGLTKLFNEMTDQEKINRFNKMINGSKSDFDQLLYQWWKNRY